MPTTSLEAPLASFVDNDNINRSENIIATTTTTADVDCSASCIRTPTTLSNYMNPTRLFEVEHRKRRKRRRLREAKVCGDKHNDASSQVPENKGATVFRLQDSLLQHTDQERRTKGAKKCLLRRRAAAKTTSTFTLVAHLLLLLLLLVLSQIHFAQILVAGSSATHASTVEERNDTGEQSDIQIFTNSIWRLPPTAERVQQSSKRKMPFGKKPQDKPLCRVWDSRSPSELCASSRWQRLKKMRELSLFLRCPEGFANMQLIDIFQLDWRHIRTEVDLLSHSEHLRASDEGQGCVLAEAGSPECQSCFNKLHVSLERLEKALWSFSNLLQRFDCRLVNKQNPTGLTATRPFSPNTTCHNCAEWYRKWLLVNLVGIWRKKPCVNWCYYTQLACPHLATNKVVEFAGHPIFLCRDQRLSAELQHTKDIMDCSCLHPCDLIQNRIAQFSPSTTTKNNKTSIRFNSGQMSFDFFHVSTYCESRDRYCFN